jgi:hypothetical protein
MEPYLLFSVVVYSVLFPHFLSVAPTDPCGVRLELILLYFAFVKDGEIGIACSTNGREEECV